MNKKSINDVYEKINEKIDLSKIEKDLVLSIIKESLLETKNDLENFSSKCEEYLKSKGIYKNKKMSKATLKFIDTFISAAENSHYKHEDGYEMLDMLSNKDYLIDNFSINVKDNLLNYIHADLLANKTFMDILKPLAQHNGKGVGKGEYLLGIILKEYKILDGDGDGNWGGKKNEVKSATTSTSSSLKPIKTRVDVIDKLNKKIFNNLEPFSEAHVDNFKDHENLKDLYSTYFKSLYKQWKDTPEMNKLVKDLVENIKNVKLCETILGNQVMKWYKEIEGFETIFIINNENYDFVIIEDFENIPNNILIFKPKMRRGGDSQAVPDGYVNIRFK
jgi:hypothetical protein